ncbi:ABC transporter substrate-binding protein [Gordonia sp. HY285]|uniref:ABC transporter substrate-binding protein n=1 Tax=Gordonia liuliyuniae TaxID=2911517 RepID=A0ABS9ITQ9_9ACTN|nr:ABC transporter substrate-binding protein [Gordonia liuliyuniae]MCF8588953.1 ABC transporter substrate-binding protein [Gordonia liuliyuniae]MCF8609166.1 ABC transporter substrate-binding protein [Gordonia liuliyuniae]
MLLLAASLAACGSGEGDSADGSGAQVKVSVTPGGIWGIPIAAAEQQGYFKSANISVEVSPAPSGMGLNQLLASGAADYGASSPSQAFAAVQQGQDVTTSCGASGKVPTSIVAPKGSSLPSVAKGASATDVLKSLRGKTLGMPAAAGTGTSNLMVKTLESVGLQEGDYTLVNVGSGGTAQAALVADQVDAAMVVTPTAETIVAEGNAVPLVELSQELPNYQLLGAVWQSRKSWVEENPKTAADFCAAMAKAYGYMNDPANADGVDKLITDAVGAGTPADAVTEIRKNFNVLDAAVDPALFQKTVDALTSVGVLEPEPAVTYDEAIMIK